MVHITTPADVFGPFSPILPVPFDGPTGWVCPRCDRVLSPMVDQCVCSPPPRRRESYTFGSFLPVAGTETPPRHPMCKCARTPCGPSREGGMCGCDEPDDDPLCASCPRPRSQHTDPASFRPRGPEKPNPLTVKAPAHLIADPNGVRLVRLTGDWAEIFTGMQARFLDEGRIQADIEFRLTPADGETGD